MAERPKYVTRKVPHYVTRYRPEWRTRTITKKVPVYGYRRVTKVIGYRTIRKAIQIPVRARRMQESEDPSPVVTPGPDAASPPPTPMPGDDFFGLDTALLNFLDKKETRDPAEWAAMKFGYPQNIPFLSPIIGTNPSMGPYNIQPTVAQEVFARHRQEIERWLAVNYTVPAPVPVPGPGPSTSGGGTVQLLELGPDPGSRQSWARLAETDVARVVAALHLRDLEEQWQAKRFVGPQVNPVTAQEAALLLYRFAPATVDNFVNNGLPGTVNDDLRGTIEDDLRRWRNSGVLN